MVFQLPGDPLDGRGVLPNEGHLAPEGEAGLGLEGCQEARLEALAVTETMRLNTIATATEQKKKT